MPLLYQVCWLSSTSFKMRLYNSITFVFCLRAVQCSSNKLKKHTHFYSKLVWGTIYANDEVPTMHRVTAGENFAIQFKSSRGWLCEYRHLPLSWSLSFCIETMIRMEDLEGIHFIMGVRRSIYVKRLVLQILQQQFAGGCSKLQLSFRKWLERLFNTISRTFRRPRRPERSQGLEVLIRPDETDPVT